MSLTEIQHCLTTANMLKKKIEACKEKLANLEYRLDLVTNDKVKQVEFINFISKINDNKWYAMPDTSNYVDLDNVDNVLEWVASELGFGPVTDEEIKSVYASQSRRFKFEYVFIDVGIKGHLEGYKGMDTVMDQIYHVGLQDRFREDTK